MQYSECTNRCIAQGHIAQCSHQADRLRFKTEPRKTLELRFLLAQHRARARSPIKGHFGGVLQVRGVKGQKMLLADRARDPLRPCLEYGRGAVCVPHLLSLLCPRALPPVCVKSHKRDLQEIPGQRGTCLWCKRSFAIVAPRVCSQPQQCNSSFARPSSTSTCASLRCTCLHLYICPKQLLQGAQPKPPDSGKKAAALTLKSAVLSAVRRADWAHSFVDVYALLGQPAKLGLKGPRVLGRIFCAARVEEVLNVSQSGSIVWVTAVSIF